MYVPSKWSAKYDRGGGPCHGCDERTLRHDSGLYSSLRARRLFVNLMHVLSFIAVAFNAFAIYCILCKSPKQMGAYKWYLLIYQLSSTLFDFVYMFFTLPVIFFPVPMGYPASWIAQWLSISGHTAVALVVTTCLCLVASIVMLFVYRCHIIIPAHHMLKANDNGYIYASVAIFVFHLLSCPVGIAGIAPDQMMAKKWCLEVSIPTVCMFVPIVTLMYIFGTTNDTKRAVTIDECLVFTIWATWGVATNKKLQNVVHPIPPMSDHASDVSDSNKEKFVTFRMRHEDPYRFTIAYTDEDSDQIYEQFMQKIAEIGRPVGKLYWVDHGDQMLISNARDLRNAMDCSGRLNLHVTATDADTAAAGNEKSSRRHHRHHRRHPPGCKLEGARNP
ncbi:7TM chemoreceptor [Teladorsagia circumcincta]|uniref:7TM chemoreceptor n=1 Tax=Teladorsagia circumcincta TaxID=45464 RepID=A0A2G9UXT9_TELCI|nr:7TM chemoreceptor [Teladorsagia circumcincta]